MSTTTSTVLGAVRNERHKQDEKWGEQNHGPIKWCAILTEEVGEVAKAALEENHPDYVKELAQVAAVAVAAIECALRGKPSA